MADRSPIGYLVIETYVLSTLALESSLYTFHSCPINSIIL